VTITSPGGGRRPATAVPPRGASKPGETRRRADPLGVPWTAWAIALGMLVLLVAVANGYGFHRDELYFILAGRHPAFGYVDQPPFTPILTAAAVSLFGLSPLAVRLAPALAAVGVVLLAADMARRLGASRSGQALAALVLALSGWLGAGHLDVTVTFDVCFWTLALWLLVPLLDVPAEGHDRRWRWLALGLVVGVALENKTLALTLPATVGASLLLLRRWDVLRRPWPWLAAVLALAIWLPNLAWQATHGFPQVTMAQAIAQDQGPGLEGRAKAIVELLALAGPLLFPVSIAGIVWLLRSPHSRPWRPLGVAVLLQVALMLVADGKSYYSAGFLPLAVAAGSLPLERWLQRGRTRLRRLGFVGAAALSGTAVALLMLPLVPVTALHETPIPAIYGESVAQVGWPQLATQVGTVVAALPVAQRRTAVIVTADYGQYSALTLLGAHLPPVYSGHNSTWDWGRPPDGAAPVILVAFDPHVAAAWFARCHSAATIDNGYDLPTQEQGAPILVCERPLLAWRTLWPSLRHVN
jgi:4-amino-4-deoxy-L-arabinose transferase-like glycosyltransferase